MSLLTQSLPYRAPAQRRAAVARRTKLKPGLAQFAANTAAMPRRLRTLFKVVYCAGLVAAVVSATSVALHAEEGTARQRQACKPDVYRLCSTYIPSRDGITYCLHLNIRRLSPDCRAVMEGRLR